MERKANRINKVNFRQDWFQFVEISSWRKGRGCMLPFGQLDSALLNLIADQSALNTKQGSWDYAMEDRKQIADYFVVAGLTQNSMPLEDFSFDGSQLKSTYDQAPITDITVIIRTLGEAVPQGFICVEHTPSGTCYITTHH